jgi:hypothetical protein
VRCDSHLTTSGGCLIVYKTSKPAHGRKVLRQDSTKALVHKMFQSTLLQLEIPSLPSSQTTALPVQTFERAQALALYLNKTLCFSADRPVRGCFFFRKGHNLDLSFVIACSWPRFTFHLRICTLNVTHGSASGIVARFAIPVCGRAVQRVLPSSDDVRASDKLAGIHTKPAADAHAQ